MSQCKSHTNLRSDCRTGVGWFEDSVVVSLFSFLGFSFVVSVVISKEGKKKTGGEEEREGNKLTAIIFLPFYLLLCSSSTDGIVYECSNTPGGTNVDINLFLNTCRDCVHPPLGSLLVIIASTSSALRR